MVCRGLYRGGGEGVCIFCGGCLVGVGRLSGVVGRLSGGCREAIWRMWGSCLVSVAGLLGGYG